MIGVDGSQHYEERNLKDEERTARLESLGYKVLRFSKYEVLTETDSALEVIYLEVGR